MTEQCFIDRLEQRVRNAKSDVVTALVNNLPISPGAIGDALAGFGLGGPSLSDLAASALRKVQNRTDTAACAAAADDQRAADAKAVADQQAADEAERLHRAGQVADQQAAERAKSDEEIRAAERQHDAEIEARRPVNA